MTNLMSAPNNAVYRRKSDWTKNSDITSQTMGRNIRRGSSSRRPSEQKWLNQTRYMDEKTWVK